MCSRLTLHHKFRIDSGRTKFKQGKTDGIFTAVNPMNKDHRDPQELGLTKPRLVSYKQEWKKASKYGVLGRYTDCSTKRIEVLSDKMYRNHPFRYTPSLLYLESSCDESEEIIYQKVSCVTSTTTEGFQHR